MEEYSRDPYVHTGRDRAQNAISGSRHIYTDGSATPATTGYGRTYLPQADDLKTSSYPTGPASYTQ